MQGASSEVDRLLKLVGEAHSFVTVHDYRAGIIGALSVSTGALTGGQRSSARSGGQRGGPGRFLDCAP